MRDLLARYLLDITFRNRLWPEIRIRESNYFLWETEDGYYVRDSTVESSASRATISLFTLKTIETDTLLSIHNHPQGSWWPSKVDRDTILLLRNAVPLKTIHFGIITPNLQGCIYDEFGNVERIGILGSIGKYKFTDENRYHKIKG